MATSMNGWTASPNLRLRPLVIDGVAFVPGIRDDDDVALVLGYVMEQFHQRVEPLANPGCWGFSFRPNVNNPRSLSNHSSGTAVDANAPQHPNGVPTTLTFTPDQIAEIHQILGEVENAVRWGGDYAGTPDAMHFEINVSKSELAAVAARLRAAQEDAMPLSDEDIAKVVKAVLDAPVDDDPEVTVRRALRRASKPLDEVAAALAKAVNAGTKKGARDGVAAAEKKEQKP